MRNLIILMIALMPLLSQASPSDTTYIKQIVDTSAIVKQNNILIQKNKDLKARNIASSTFAGLGFITTISLLGYVLRP